MRKDITLAALSAVALAATPAFAETTRTYEHSGFVEIEVHDGLSATIMPGDQHAVKVTSNDDSLFEKLVIEQRGDKLIVKRKPVWGLIDLLPFGNNWSDKISVEITTPKLTELSASSGADVRLQQFEASNLVLESSSGADLIVNDIIAERLHIEAGAGASLSISGTCVAVMAEASSGADIWAEKLTCASGEIGVSSGADIDITITGELEAEATSGGSASIFGKPTPVRVEQGSGGSISYKN